MGPVNRRAFLKSAAPAATAGPLLSIGADAQGKPVVNMQLGWLLGGNQIGEVVRQAARLLRRRKASS